MITLDLRNLTSQDMKDILYLKKSGVPDETIQAGYENTKKNRAPMVCQFVCPSCGHVFKKESPNMQMLGSASCPRCGDDAKRHCVFYDE